MNFLDENVNELFFDVFNNILSYEEYWLFKKKINLTINEVHVIEAIGKEKIIKSGDLSRKLNVTKGTLTVVANRLFSKEYIDRLKNDNDKRLVYLSLTQKGEKIFKEHEKFHIAMIEEIKKVLKKEEMVVLAKAIGNINSFFKKIEKSK